jgi:hypothetical protein
VVNQLPKDSLVYDDIRGDPAQLIERVSKVANYIGAAKARSRIVSNGNIMRVPGARDLQQWWRSASEEQKFLLLSSRNRQGKDKSRYPALNFAEEEAMAGLQYPFRGIGAVMDTEEDGGDSFE